MIKEIYIAVKRMVMTVLFMAVVAVNAVADEEKEEAYRQSFQRHRYCIY